VLVDDRVVHRREPAPGEPGRQVVRRVEARRVRRVRHAGERGYHQRTTAHQVGRGVLVGEPAADEQRPAHVHGRKPGGRVLVQVHALDGQAGERPGGEVVFEFLPGLDLVRGVVERERDVGRRRCGHAAILPYRGPSGRRVGGPGDRTTREKRRGPD
jgi:hypothetical protein